MPNVSQKEIEGLAALLRYGLFDGPLPQGLPQSQTEWQTLFDLSRRQAVTALLYDALLKLPAAMRPPRQVLFRFVSIVQTIEDDNRRREKALRDFAALCGEQLDLPLAVVKGTSLARRYPEPLHRECGDNDLLTRGDTERVASLVESKGIAVDRKDPRHVAFKYGGVTFESHSYLLYHNDDPDWHCVAFDRNLLALPVEEEAFFLAKHCEHHAVFFHNPIRLRTLVDWAMLLGSEGFDFEAFCRLKKGTDVEVFADLLTLYCSRTLGTGIRYDLKSLEDKRLDENDFFNIYMRCPERHRSAVVRVARRSWKYLRYWRQYKAIYGRSMFRRFYLRNIGVAMKQKFD